MSAHLAQVNIAALIAPLDSPELADFMAALDPINAIADVAAGFIWRLQADDGNATSIVAFESEVGGGAGVITNLSLWRDVKSLRAFVYDTAHRDILRGRRSWFITMREAHTACWWLPMGILPDVVDAERRIRHLRERGPTPSAFTLHTSFPPPIAHLHTVANPTSATRG